MCLLSVTIDLGNLKSTETIDQEEKMNENDSSSQNYGD